MYIQWAKKTEQKSPTETYSKELESLATPLPKGEKIPLFSSLQCFFSYNHISKRNKMLYDQQTDEQILSTAQSQQILQGLGSPTQTSAHTDTPGKNILSHDFSRCVQRTLAPQVCTPRLTRNNHNGYHTSCSGSSEPRTPQIRISPVGLGFQTSKSGVKQRQMQVNILSLMSPSSKLWNLIVGTPNLGASQTEVWGTLLGLGFA